MPFLSQVLGRPVFDSDGARVGTVRDFLIASDLPYPPVVALVIDTRDGAREVPWIDVASVTPRGAALNRIFKPELYAPPQHLDLVWLRRDVLDRQIVDTTGMKLVRVNDIAITPLNDDLRVAGVDSSFAGLLRRLGLERLAGGRYRLIDWEQVDIGPALSEVRLKVPYDRLRRMHPADIATVVSQMSPGKAADVFEAIEDETAARALAELSDEHQAVVLAAMEPEEAADVLEEMEPDEAADVLGDVTEERAEELMRLMEPEAASAVRSLLSYPEDTAGGLMNSNVVAVHDSDTVADGIEALRRAAADGHDADGLYVVDDDGRLLGSLSLLALVVSDPATPVRLAMRRDIQSIPIDTPAEDVARTLVHYDLLSVPVIDPEGRLKGVVTIGDVIDLFAPRAWRSRPVRMLS